MMMLIDDNVFWIIWITWIVIYFYYSVNLYQFIAFRYKLIIFKLNNYIYSDPFVQILKKSWPVFPRKIFWPNKFLLQAVSWQVASWQVVKGDDVEGKQKWRNIK